MWSFVIERFIYHLQCTAILGTVGFVLEQGIKLHRNIFEIMPAQLTLDSQLDRDTNYSREYSNKNPFGD